MNRLFLLLIFIFMGSGPLPGQAQKYRLEEASKPTKKEKSKNKKKQKLVDQVALGFYEKGVQALKDGELEKAEAYFDRVLILKPDDQKAREGLRLIMKMVDEDEPDPVPNQEAAEVALVKKLNQDLSAAVEAGQWEKADNLLKKVLAIDPDNTDAQAKKNRIHQKLHLRFFKKGERLEKNKKWIQAVDAYQTALVYKRNPSLQKKIKTLRAKMVATNKKKSDDIYIQALKANQEGDLDTALALCKKSLTFNPDNIQAKQMKIRLESRLRR